jgi:hypothetical protein
LLQDSQVSQSLNPGLSGGQRKPQLATSSVADPNPDPNPPDPHVFGPPGFGSGSFYYHAKIVRKTLIPTAYFATLFDFLSLNNGVNVASKSNKQKKLHNSYS